MMAAAARTGQRVTLPDDISVVTSFLLSFFCISKVMLMQLAYSREGSVWLTSQPLLKNQRFWRQSNLVLCFSCCWTLTYLHELMAKKKARIVRCDIAGCSPVKFFSVILAMTQVGMTFCYFSLGSAFLKARNRQCKMKLSWSSSLVRLGRLFSQKVADLSKMVFWIVPKAKVL